MGVTCLRRIPDIRRTKLSSKADICVFLVFVENSKSANYQILTLTPSSKLGMQFSLRISLSRTKTNRSKMFLKDVPENAENSIAPDESISLEAKSVNAKEEILEVVEPASKRIREQDFGDDFITYNVEGYSQIFQKAIQFKDALLWKEVIEDKMDSLSQNHT